MSWKLEVRPAAREEFLEAAEWYLRDDVFAKDRFVRAVRETTDSIRTRPLTFPVIFGTEVRRATVHKFPYSVFFTVEENRIFVIAIFHDSRNPIIWRGRID